VYRTYLRGDGVDTEDRRYIEWAIGRARSRDLASEGSVYAFLRRVLLTETDDEALRERYVEFGMRFQQLTSPVAAKGVEDTAFYRSVRLVALNEVGGDPGRFGTPVAEFHRQNAARAAARPSAMVTTSTHDAKRGEDVRARIAVISEMPEAWRRAVGRWSRLNARHAVKLPSGRSPTPLAEYLLYQTLVGAWPAELLAGGPDARALAAFADRIAAYMVKAGREAKLRTSWANPDETYEQALERFVRRLLDPRSARAFLESIREFTRGLASAALANSLAQVVLRTTAPGVPDTYQGSEVWEFSLVDPDNRRPVDFAARAALLAGLDAALGAGIPRERLAADLLTEWHDGRIKFYVLATLLRHRAEAAWPNDAYVALDAAGTHAAHVVAYTRGNAVVVTPRLSHVLAGEALPVGAIWQTTVLHLPPGAPERYRDVLSGREAIAEQREDALVLPLARALAVLPVAVLEPI
jgi:(1->4)-alpha-D-glucan 1-alpha-D-glucosylmutase